MADTVVELGLQAMKGVLDAVKNAQGLYEVYRMRTDEPKTFPVLNLLDGPQEVITIFQKDQYTQRPIVEVYVKETTTNEAARRLEEIRGHVVKAMEADRTLGGAAADVRFVGTADPDASAEPRDFEYLLLALEFELEVYTEEGDPFTASQ